MRLILIVTILFSTRFPLFAQEGEVSLNKSQRLTLKSGRGTINATGFIGGEAHDRYIVNVEAGKILEVRILSPKNRAITMVSAAKKFSDAEPATFGADLGNLWSGRVPTTADYYVFVLAHPDSRYTLRVTVR